MSQVEIKSLLSYFSPDQHDDADDHGFWLLHRYRYLFNPFVLYCFSCSLFLLGGFLSRTLLILGLSLVICGVYLYFSIRASAYNINIKRSSFKPQWIEGDLATITIEIRNKGGFHLPSLIIEDRFEGSLQNQVSLVTTQPIRPHKTVRLQYQRLCDGGMGKHHLGPLIVKLSDPFALFEFKVIEDSLSEIEVLPKIEHLTEMHFRGSPLSHQYGHYDVSQRGLSVNFSGIRPYSPGDSLRHIAWKLSMRSQSLLVKEFETTVNSEITLVLDLNPETHIGIKSQSTWEYARDAALGILAQQLDMQNAVRLISNHYYSQLGRGEDHLHDLCYQVSRWTPEKFLHEPSLMKWGSGDELLKHSSLLMGRASTLIYVTPYHHTQFARARQTLMSLRESTLDIFVVFIDTGSFVGGLSSKLDWVHLTERSGNKGLENEIALLKQLGILSYRLRYGEALAKGFAQHA